MDIPTELLKQFGAIGLTVAILWWIMKRDREDNKSERIEMRENHVQETKYLQDAIKEDKEAAMVVQEKTIAVMDKTATIIGDMRTVLNSINEKLKIK